MQPTRIIITTAAIMMAASRAVMSGATPKLNEMTYGLCMARATGLAVICYDQAGLTLYGKRAMNESAITACNVALDIDVYICALLACPNVDIGAILANLTEATRLRTQA